MDYRELFRNLGYHTAMVKFRKKDGTLRVMLCTRNIDTMELLGSAVRLNGYDARCSVANGNIAVVDLVIGEPRQFSISRVESVDLFGEVTDLETLGELVEKYEEIEKTIENRPISLDDLD